MTDLTTLLPTLIASAFGGGIVAGAFSVHNRIAAKTEEHEKWLRNQKMEAYGTFISAAQALVVALSGYRGGEISKDDALAKFVEAQLGPIELLAPEQVRDAAMALEKVTDVMFHEVIYGSALNERDSFMTAVEDYKTKKRSFLTLAQSDLSISYAEYPVSGSQLEESALVGAGGKNGND